MSKKLKTPEQTKRAALRELKRSKAKTPHQTALAVRKDLKKYGITATKKVKIKNPITGKTNTITLRRDGTPESDLVLALLDKKSTRDRKDYALSMYFWGRGAENASMMVDLMRYKGEHTKETRVFKSQMRYDFESFISVFSEFLSGQAKRTSKILGVDIDAEIKEYYEWLSINNNKKRGATYDEFAAQKYGTVDKVRCALISEAMFSIDMVEHLTETRNAITKAREREKGGGVYVDRHGKPYTIDEPLLDDIIKEDLEATREIEKE